MSLIDYPLTSKQNLSGECTGMVRPGLHLAEFCLGLGKVPQHGRSGTLASLKCHLARTPCHPNGAPQLEQKRILNVASAWHLIHRRS